MKNHFVRENKILQKKHFDYVFKKLQRKGSTPDRRAPSTSSPNSSHPIIVTAEGFSCYPTLIKRLKLIRVFSFFFLFSLPNHLLLHLSRISLSYFFLLYFQQNRHSSSSSPKNSLISLLS